MSNPNFSNEPRNNVPAPRHPVTLAERNAAAEDGVVRDWVVSESQLEHGREKTKPEYLPDSNPKTVAGSKKVPLHLVPSSATIGMATALANGAEKYGPYNWREIPVAASPYISAAKRHLDAWFDGEDLAADSGINHIAHAMAGLAVLYDCMMSGTLIDDRPTPGAAARMLEDYNRLKS
jgi:hypothetical protein